MRFVVAIANSSAYEKLAGIVAWVASIPFNVGDGDGDLHFISVCSHDLISRIALADVSGHGREIDAAAVTLLEMMRKYIDVWGQSDFMRGLNDTFNRGSQYVTAIVLCFHRSLATYPLCGTTLLNGPGAG